MPTFPSKAPARRQVYYGCVVVTKLKKSSNQCIGVQALAFYDTPNCPRHHMRVRVLYDMPTKHGARDPTIGAANEEEAMDAIVKQSCAKEPVMLPRVSGSFLRGLPFGTCKCCGATPMHETMIVGGGEHVCAFMRVQRGGIALWSSEACVRVRTSYMCAPRGQGRWQGPRYPRITQRVRVGELGPKLYSLGRARLVSRSGENKGNSAGCEPSTLYRAVWSRPTHRQRSARTSSPRRDRTARASQGM